jgi:hypothetical protein
VARWFRCGLSVSGSFVRRCLTSQTILRFHLPLIEPDGRIFRIRLSDKAHSCFRPRETTRKFRRVLAAVASKAIMAVPTSPVRRRSMAVDWTSAVG